MQVPILARLRLWQMLHGNCPVMFFLVADAVRYVYSSVMFSIFNIGWLLLKKIIYTAVSYIGLWREKE